MKKTFTSIMERAIIIKEHVQQMIELLPTNQWNSFDATTQETIYDSFLDKSLCLEHIYDDLTDVLYTSTLPTIMMHETVISNKKGDAYSNKAMSYCLLHGDVSFKNKDGYFDGNDLLRDLLFHIYTKVKYINIIKKAESPRKAYNYVYTSVKHKLIDLCREQNKKYIFEPIDGTVTTKKGEKVMKQYASTENIEEELCTPCPLEVLEIAKDLLVPQLIYVMKKHPDRMLIYLSNLVGNSSAVLLESINTHGYKATLNVLVDKALEKGINLQYLKSENFNYKINSNSVEHQHIYNWTNRMHRDFKENEKIRKIVEEFVIQYV